MSTTRRRFIGSAALGAAVAQAAPSPVLNERETALLLALCEQILPDDELPGAKEAGVLGYIDRQLSGALKRFAGTYRKGLGALDKLGFLDKSFDERTLLLERAEAGEVRGVPGAFVRLVADHTLQGFFGDPKHGGNRGESAWRMLGIGQGHRHEERAQPEQTQ